MPNGFQRCFRFLRLCGLLLLAALACSSPSSPEHNSRIARNYDTTPLNVASLAKDLALQRRVLAMPVGEAIARLGSFTFEGRSFFSFSRGTRETAQADRYEAHVDPEQNFRVKIDTGNTLVEAFVVGDEMFVRQNLGHLRSKPNRDATTIEKWTELVWTSQRSALEPFFGRLVLSDDGTETLDGRTVQRFSLALGDPHNENEKVVEGLPPTSLPIAAPSGWRESASARGLNGSIWVDSETGVILKSKIEGRLEISDEEVRPTQLTVRYEGLLKDVGVAPAVDAPKDSRPEYVRTPRPVDQLSFFRSELPKPEEAETP